ncbi:MAG: FHA domain-containing protein [Pirellulaceae bacterium]|nr:FHA domain-containing protein [Pirellulaceae bacterium]
MFQSWRLKLREAETACEHGRLQEAVELVRSSRLDQYLPGRRLAQRIAERLVERSRQQFQTGLQEAGRDDMNAAAALVRESDALLSLRNELQSDALTEAYEHLDSGNPQAAIARLEFLDRLQIRSEQARVAMEAARRMESARRLCAKGDFTEADQQLEEAVALLPQVNGFEERRRWCDDQREKMRHVAEQLHRAMSESHWSEVVSLSDQILEIAPESTLARNARRRAWEKVGAGRANLADTQHYKRDEQPAATSGDALVAERNDARFLLWVDAVGGFLVCLGDEITVGQAAPHNDVDVAILADLRRRHAKIRREGEGYVVEPIELTKLNDQAIDSTQVLSDGDVMELGEGVRLRFRQPHALSTSARLELASRHRTQPGADGVLMMAESCVLGPNRQNHVVCHDWTTDVVLFRHDDDLYCRSMETLEIDGKHCEGRGRIHTNSRICSEEFAMSLEAIGGR